jgi:hypothetical protein
MVVPEKIYLLASYKQNIKDHGEKAFIAQSSNPVLCSEPTNKTMVNLFFTREFSQTFWWKLNQVFFLTQRIYSA